jgi:hypothetical protein
MFNVTCNTAKCENESLTIRIESEDSKPVVMCGACGNYITDIVAV